MGRRRINALVSSCSAMVEARERLRREKGEALRAKGYVSIGTAEALGGLNGALWKMVFGRSPLCELVDRVFVSGRVFDFWVPHWAMVTVCALKDYMCLQSEAEVAGIVRGHLKRLLGAEELRQAVLAAYDMGGETAVAELVLYREEQA